CLRIGAVHAISSIAQAGAVARSRLLAVSRPRSDGRAAPAQWSRLPRAPAREDEPAVERGCATRAASAWSDSNGIGGSLDDVAQADLFVGDEPGQPHLMRLAWRLLVTISARPLPVHVLHPLPCAVAIV